MKIIRLFVITALLLLTQLSIDAQTKKTTTRRSHAQTAKVEPPKVEEKEDSVVVPPKPEEPKYKSLNDPMVVKYLRGGFAKEKKLHLMTNADYDSLSIIQKQDVLNRVAQEFAEHDITIYYRNQQRESLVSR